MTQPADDRLLNAVAELAREEHVQRMSQDLSDPVFAELSEAELQMLASAVAEQLTREPRLPEPPQAQPQPAQERAPEQQPSASARRPVGRRLSWLALAATLLGGGLWLVQHVPLQSEPVAQRAPASGDERRLALPDGSTLALSSQTEARVVTLDPREVRVQLDRGSVECEVAHNPERRFVVAAGALEVVVKGTRFTVSAALDAAAAQHVEVSVERGLVEVRQPPDRVLALLGAGQRWSSAGSNWPPLTSGETPAPAAPALPPAPPPEPAPSRAVPSPLPAPAPAPAPAQPVARAAPGARELFERADAARLAGHASEAAAAFDELRRRYPGDARAGYAAFMLGRIRLDSLADANGAAEAFAFAIAHPGSGFFLEDAAARRVEALDRSGRTSECLLAREQFREQYPRAVRGPLVAKLCGPR